jgi:hypothetical protein
MIYLLIDWLIDLCWGLNPGSQACGTNSLPLELHPNDLQIGK